MKDKIIVSMYPGPFDNQFRHEHNSSIFKDGDIYAYEDEKISSIKEDGLGFFPERSLLAGMKELNVDPSRVKKWILPKPKRKIQKHEYYTFFHTLLKSYIGEKKNFNKWFSKKIIFVKHHDMHIFSAVGASNFKKTFYLSSDGGGDLGDTRNTSWGIYYKNKIKEYGKLYSVNSVASFHAFVTEACGFHDENGKLSGISSYGKFNSELYNNFSKLLKVNNRGIIFERKRFNQTKPKINNYSFDNYQRNKIFNAEISKTNVLKMVSGYLIEDIAATAERVISDKIIEFLKLVKKKLPKDIENAVFSGGLFLNVKLNDKINNSKIFKNSHFSMCPSDSGLALGGIFSQNIKLKKKYYSKKGLSPLLGPSFSDKEVVNILLKYNFKSKKLGQNYSKEVAREIANGKIVGIFNGRAEFGKRSLGSRSILADPRKKYLKQKINLYLKKRDWFMPYAPAILDSHHYGYFSNKNPSMYMQFAEKINADKKKIIPGAIHVDNTCRTQFIDKKIFKNFWEIVYEFFKRTNVPLVLNTSFNRHGISTISSPRQALEHLNENCIDVLFLNSFKINNYNKTKNKKFKFYKEIDLLKIQNLKWFDKIKIFMTKNEKKMFNTYYEKKFNQKN